MLKEARDLSLQTRDTRQAAECQVILADVLLCQGKLKAALAAADEVLVEGRARCDPQQEVHARNLRALVLSLGPDRPGPWLPFRSPAPGRGARRHRSEAARARLQECEIHLKIAAL